MGKSGAVFNIEKLNSVNKHYIKNASARSLVAEVRSRLVAHGMTIPTDEYIWHVIEMMRERVATTRGIRHRVSVLLF